MYRNRQVNWPFAALDTIEVQTDSKADWSWQLFGKGRKKELYINKYDEIL